MSTVADTQKPHIQLEAVEVYHLIVATVARAQNANSPQTFFVHEHGEPFGVTITVEPESDAIATYSAYITALLCDIQAVIGPCKRNPGLTLWYQVLERQLGIESAA